MALTINAINIKLNCNLRLIKIYKLFSRIILSILQYMNFDLLRKSRFKLYFFRYLGDKFLPKINTLE